MKILVTQSGKNNTTLHACLKMGQDMASGQRNNLE